MGFDALLLAFNFWKAGRIPFNFQRSRGLTNRYDFEILELSILASVSCQVSDTIWSGFCHYEVYFVSIICAASPLFMFYQIWVMQCS
jgi:hypothetical protein